MLWECSDNGLFSFKAQGFLHGECVVNLKETAGIFDHIPMSASWWGQAIKLKIRLVCNSVIVELFIKTDCTSNSKVTGKSCKQKSDCSNIQASPSALPQNLRILKNSSWHRIITEHTSLCQAAMGANVCFRSLITQQLSALAPSHNPIRHDASASLLVFTVHPELWEAVELLRAGVSNLWYWKCIAWDLRYPNYLSRMNT